MTIAGKLNDEIKKVAPIISVSIGKIDDKTTWRIEFEDGATDKEKNAAKSVIKSFDATAKSKDVFLEEKLKNELVSTESTAEIARKMEDLVLLLDANGMVVPGEIRNWAKSRKSNRDKIKNKGK